MSFRERRDKKTKLLKQVDLRLRKIEQEGSCGFIRRIAKIDLQNEINRLEAIRERLCRDNEMMLSTTEEAVRELSPVLKHCNIRNACKTLGIDPDEKDGQPLKIKATIAIYAILEEYQVEKMMTYIEAKKLFENHTFSYPTYKMPVYREQMERELERLKILSLYSTL